MQGVFHIEKGKGPVLVLLHGFCETHEIWNEVAEELASHVHLLIPDLPGFGKSPLPADPFSLSDIALLLWKWLDDQEILRPVIIGHSLGGYLTLSMASQRPDKMNGLGLFHSSAYADSSEKKENRNKVMDFVKTHGVGPFVDTFVPGLFHKKDHPSLPFVDKICRQTNPESLLAYTQAMRDRPDHQAVLTDFSNPILLVAGEEDGIIPVEIVSKQASLPKKGQFEILKETGHMGMLEATHQSIGAILAFMSACK